MKTDPYTKVVLSVIAVLLFLNLLTGLFSTKPATAEQNSQIQRYQISAWAAQIGTYGHHAGYYIVDTTTGRIFDKGEEVHAITPKQP